MSAVSEVTNLTKSKLRERKFVRAGALFTLYFNSAYYSGQMFNGWACSILKNTSSNCDTDTVHNGTTISDCYSSDLTAYSNNAYGMKHRSISSSLLEYSTWSSNKYLLKSGRSAIHNHSQECVSSIKLPVYECLQYVTPIIESTRLQKTFEITKSNRYPRTIKFNTNPCH